MPQLDQLDAAILCGGMGTRLSAAVPGLPKCLAPVAGRRFLEYLLLQLGSFGIGNAVLCVGYRSQQVEDFFQSGSRWRMSLKYVHEEQPLGTGGALKGACSTLRSNPFLVLNGDSIFDIDLGSLLASHGTRPARATLALASSPAGGRYGRVRVDAGGNITAFEERASAEDAPAAGNGCRHAINAGVYIFSRDVLEEIPSSSSPVSLEREILPHLVGRGLFGHVCDGYFIDIGVPEDYARAQEELPWRFQHN
jgi:D-glycero-alpha-D-manno-heptose 1-phosphate guanylyltransferase